jgi:hypothetical protein
VAAPASIATVGAVFAIFSTVSASSIAVFAAAAPGPSVATVAARPAVAAGSSVRADPNKVPHRAWRRQLGDGDFLHVGDAINSDAHVIRKREDIAIGVVGNLNFDI